ncbi:MAG: 50S ribosomal protein L11 methyltransferase [Candidatus Thermoplasmatota archaeon]|nr:50S ribosomal protein L11 methyltransferase [Candidatus Thermoplasmatota archaeon]
MKKRHLEMSISEMRDIEGPIASLEQYRTPASMVADILWDALDRGDVAGRSILELGCGGAPFALGALMLGADSAVGVDIDPRCLEIAWKNFEGCVKEGYLDGNTDLCLMEGDISDPSLSVPGSDTVFMNPPFGAQNRHADRDFIKKACHSSSVIYSIHNGGTDRFVRSEYGRMGASDVEMVKAIMELPHRFHFHRSEKGKVPVLLVRACVRR